MNKFLFKGILALGVAGTMSIASADVGGYSSLEERVRALEEELAALRDITERQGPPKDNAMTAFWKDGLRFETADKMFSIRINGRIMADYWWISDNASPFQENVNSGVRFRRARLEMKGSIYKDIFYEGVYDFASAEFKDVVIGLKNVPYVQTVKVGQYKVPFGLEELTSSKYISFMERSMVTNAFAPGRRMGGGFSQNLLDKAATLNTMFFSAGSQVNGFGDDEEIAEGNFGAAIRGTYQYKIGGDKKHFVHLGGAYAYENYKNGNEDPDVRFRARPGVGFIGRVVDTGNMSDADVHRFGAELAYVNGPFHAQGEFMAAIVDGFFTPNDGSNTASYWGAYGQIGYFWTGESRPYKGGSFKRVKPKKNFALGEAGAWGAFESVFRFDFVDADATNTPGDAGEGYGIGTGLNWYLNPNTRVMLNYTYTRVDDRTDGPGNGQDDFDVHAVGSRFQIDF